MFFFSFNFDMELRISTPRSQFDQPFAPNAGNASRDWNFITKLIEKFIEKHIEKVMEKLIVVKIESESRSQTSFYHRNKLTRGHGQRRRPTGNQQMQLPTNLVVEALPVRLPSNASKQRRSGRRKRPLDALINYKINNQVAA